ncbi:unnamed protein product [Prunus armeniaca]
MNCMPFIGLDVCHLKGVYGGQLLTAVGIDPNNETWVLAYDVVKWKQESQGRGSLICWSRMWTLLILMDGPLYLTGKKDCIVHLKTFCLMLRQDSVRGTFWMTSTKLIKFWGISCGYVLELPMCLLFKYQIEVMKTLNSNAWEWLAKKPPTQWFKSHFRTLIKYAMLQNNLR